MLLSDSFYCGWRGRRSSKWLHLDLEEETWDKGMTEVEAFQEFYQLLTTQIQQWEARGRTGRIS